MLTDAAAIIHQLVPAKYRREVLSALARSVQLAAHEGPDRWGVRVDSSIMLKVGPHEVLQVGSWKLPFHLVVDRDLVPRALRRRAGLAFSGDRDHHGHRATGGFYPSNAGTEACDLDFSAVGEVYDALFEAHAAAIGRAARMRRHPSTRKTHSMEFVEFISLQSGYRLAQPAYVGGDVNSTFFAEEVWPNETYYEGAVRSVMVNAYERNPRARAQCIAHYGPTCAACGMNFEQRYGRAAAGIIHVHHLVALSEIGAEYEVDPIRDLRPVCPNCHAVIHSSRKHLKIEDVAAMLRRSEDRLTPRLQRTAEAAR